MNKSEKRYFRMSADMQKGEKGYLTLFDYLNKCAVFDDGVVKELETVFPGTSIEPARKHLYRVLLRSMRQFDTSKDIETKLMNLLQDSRILYNKGLLKLSFDQLERIKTIALHREKFIYYILAARQELQYLVRQQLEGVNEYQLIEKQKKITELLAHENNISQHAMLYEVLLLRYWKNGMVRSQQEITQLNDLLLEEYQLLNRPGEKSFEQQQLHLHFQSIYFQMTGNPQGSLQVFYELDDLFQKHEHLWRDEPLYYFHLLDGILYDLRWMERHDDLTYFLKRLKDLSAVTENLATMIRYRVLEHELNTHVDRGCYREAHGQLKEFTALLNEAAQLPFHMYAQLMFAVARVQFGVGDYSAALKLINAVLNKPTSTMNRSLYMIFQTLNLMVNAAMDNKDYLLYAIRSAERKMKNERKLYGTELLILSSLRRWIALKPVKDIEAQVAKLADNPYERQLLKELCVKEWIGRMKFKVSGSGLKV